MSKLIVKQNLKTTNEKTKKVIKLV